METEKPSALNQRLQAAKERREKQQKEREAQRTEMVSKLEETEKRRQDIASKRDAEIEAKKGHAQSRHEEAQKRREVQMRARREKLLNDVEKSDRLSREAKRRNRHSWGGNINEVFGTDMLDTGGEELPDRPRPTALPKTMQNWISGLRSYADDENPDSSLLSHSNPSPREKSFNVPERLLTPTAASKAKLRLTPDGATSDDSNIPNEKGDFGGKLKRRTVSSLDIDRLSRPKNRGSSATRGQPDGGFSTGKLTRASSVTHLANPSTPKFPIRQTRSRQSSRDDAKPTRPMTASLTQPRPAPEGSDTKKKVRPTSAKPVSVTNTKPTQKTTPKTSKMTEPKNTDSKNSTHKNVPKNVTPKQKPNSNLKNEPKHPVANSTPKPDQTKQAKPQSDGNTKEPTLQQQMDLEDLEDDLPEVELRIKDEPSDEAKNCLDFKDSADHGNVLNISSDTITIEKPSTDNLIDITKETENPIQDSQASDKDTGVLINDADGKSNLSSEIDFSSLNLKKVETRVAQEFPISGPTREFPVDSRNPADQSAGDISIGSSEVVYEERDAVKNLASKFSQGIHSQNDQSLTVSENRFSLKNESMTSLASTSMTSITSTDTDKGIMKKQKPILIRKYSDTIRSEGLEGRNSPSERKSVTWDEEIERVESIEITPGVKSEVNTESNLVVEDNLTSEGGTKDKKKKKKKDKEKEKKDKPKKDKKKGKKDSDQSKNNSMIMGWLSNNETNNDSETLPTSEGVDQSVEQSVNPTGIQNQDEDEYKRRIAEQKRLHQLKKQQEQDERIAEQKAAEQKEVERKEREKKAKLDALDAKVEEEKRKMEEKMNLNIIESLKEKEQKRREEEDQRKARKERIAAIMRRTRENNNEDTQASSELSERLMQRTTSSENGSNGTPPVSDITSRVDSLLGSLRNSDSLNLHRASPSQSTQENSVNQAVPSVQ